MERSEAKTDKKEQERADAKLRQLQLVQLEILKKLDEICKRNDIHYQLFAGTALGAVRHRGFIPWDDDLDVVMLREDYEKFLKIAPQQIGNAYFLQKEFSEHWPMQFSKLRKNDTAFIERYIAKDEQTHMGVYLDIFPCDNLSDHKIWQNVQFFASKVVIARSLDQRGYLTDNPLKKIILLLSRISPRDLCLKITMMERKTDTKNVHVFLGAASKKSHSVFPRKWLEESVVMSFEDGMFPVSADYDQMLTVLYGDYRKPTPPEKRGQKKHAEIVDLEHSWEQYRGIQKKMKFEEYTRSIR